jgi:hypothetical protein
MIEIEKKGGTVVFLSSDAPPGGEKFGRGRGRGGGANEDFRTTPFTNDLFSAESSAGKQRTNEFPKSQWTWATQPPNAGA